MGWDFTEGATKKDVINEICHGDSRRTVIERSLKGSVLWTVEQVVTGTGTGKFIGCYLLGSEKGFGWGYKAMTESMGPCYYTCPVQFLDMVPDPGGYATAWREQVRKRAARTAGLRVGCRVRLVDGCKLLDGTLLPTVTITSLKPLRGRVGYQQLKLSRRLIAEVIAED